MDIKEIMTDGKIDGIKIHRQWYWAFYTGNYTANSLAEFAEAINAHISGLTQETPITPELLERAGFEAEYSPRFTRNGYRKGEFFVSDDLLVLGGKMAFSVDTMEELSTIHECYTTHPLNWQHDQAAESRKRLEAMGFAQQKDKNVYCGNVGGIMLSIEVDNFAVYNFCPGYPLSKTGIKTIDALERVVKELKGE